MDDLVRILLVDDEPRNLVALEAVLAATGCRLERAQSADEALLALLDNDFAAIVLDIKMPGMDGIELAQLIKARRRSKDVPILFLTAHMLDEVDVLRGYAVGAVDYLTKPLNPEILRSKISVFVDLYRKRHAITIANDALQREVAEREKAESELQQSKQQLEMRVLARTAEVMHAHDILRDSEERLRIALDAGKMGTWETDEATGETRIDDVQCGLLCLPSGTKTVTYEEAYANVVHPEDRERVRQTVQRAREMSGVNGAALEVEFRVTRPWDNSVRWLLTRGRFVRGAGNSVGRIVGVSWDITERKQIEDALRDADRRKNDFLATLAHELRNPLAPIRNAIQILLLKGDPKPDLESARQVIARQTQHLSRLVDDLLDISRITRDKLELRKEQIELAKVVQLAVETSQPLIDGGAHELTVSLPDEPIVLSADVTRLAQVIANLLNNAAKYTERHGRISVSVTREGSDALVRVKDSGVGIPPAMLPQIFDMFVQLDRSRERTNGGLGVGLALAKRLVEMHDGSIEVESQGPGEGSEFTIRLPVRVPAEPQRVLADEHSGTEMTSSLRVLVVDDNRDAVESLSMLLQIMGNDVRTANDGLDAVNAAREFRPDVVLLDIGLPKMNGYEAAKLMRAQSNGRHMVLIALTGWGQEEDRHQSLASGFDHHLVKPVEPSALMKLIVELGAASYDTPAIAADSSMHV